MGNNYAIRQTKAACPFLRLGSWMIGSLIIVTLFLLCFKRQLKDLGLFILILLIFIVNYGVASRALMYPNIIPSYNMILQPYLMIFGAMDAGEVQGLIFH